MPDLSFAYYCSGHGYGHATRVSAFASHLLSLNPSPTVHIVSSAPKHVFADSIARGALYRYANIDPVIVQPLAYRVDRQKSVQVLQEFLEQKDTKISQEVQWLRDTKIDCVLSDAAFLAFLAANQACLPSILITNFTFDSVYSYLSASFIDQSRPHQPNLHPLSTHCAISEPDEPIPEALVNSLVDQLHEGYRHADMLLRLPGAVPIPSFPNEPALPSPTWIDPTTLTFKPPVVAHLHKSLKTLPLHPSIPFQPEPCASKPKPLPRTAHPAPLLVRTANPAVYTPAGRGRFLTSLGIPTHLHDPATTKILVVSFGGQVIHKPSRSRSHSRQPSGATTPHPRTPRGLALDLPADGGGDGNGLALGELHDSLDKLAASKEQNGNDKDKTPPRANGRSKQTLAVPSTPTPISTPSHIYIPGAPAPASKSPLMPTFATVPPTPPARGAFAQSPWGIPYGDTEAEADMGMESQFLPDASWIAVVCGVADSKEWRRGGGDGDDEDALPDGFFIAPKGVYMPDLMAVGDVLLGKLGYGTVSECVESCTPFVYVSRPLFIEEHGLRLLLDHEGVGVEMAHEEYEAGEWAARIREAWARGAQAKRERRAGVRVVDRVAKGREMAEFVVRWVDEWASHEIEGSGQ
ncbi:hypothetical protein DENSPDRAFT_869249 [Dentipellis sp. KUC8613]|nr:hypothetical protein DENSPDRAFT_869249 [Dentipellis sp. KUC8613]